MVSYSFLVGNRKTKDCERAVLPTILFARNAENVSDCKIVVWAISIGWWAWAIGVARTSVKSEIF